MFGNTGFGQKPAGGFGTSNTGGSGGGFSFGQNNTTTTNQSNTGGGFSFGQNNTNTTNATTASTGGGLFGAKPATTTGGGFGFGQNNAASNTTTTGNTGGGFGFGQNANTNTTTTNTNTGGGLFGAKPATTTTGGGLFGQNTSNTGTTGTTTGGGLFGQKPATTTATGGLFGQNTNTTTTTGGGLFGQKPATATTGTTGGLFGAKPATTGAGFGGGFGQQQQQQQVQQAPLSVTPLTRPSDLPENMQKEFEQIDEYIQQQARICDELSTNKSEHQETIESIPRDAELISRKYVTAYEALVHDSEKMNEIKIQSDAAAEEAQTCFNLLNYLTSQNPGRLNSNRSAGAPRENGDPLLIYFKSKCEEYERRIEELAHATAEVEAAVVGLEQTGPQNPTLVIDNFTISLEELYKLFMGLGNRVAELHHVVERLEQRK